jgi:hypothetical protein
MELGKGKSSMSEKVIGEQEGEKPDNKVVGKVNKESKNPSKLFKKLSDSGGEEEWKAGMKREGKDGKYAKEEKEEKEEMDGKGKPKFLPNRLKRKISDGQVMKERLDHGRNVTQLAKELMELKETVLTKRWNRNHNENGKAVGVEAKDPRGYAKEVK